MYNPEDTQDIVASYLKFSHDVHNGAPLPPEEEYWPDESERQAYEKECQFERDHPDYHEKQEQFASHCKLPHEVITFEVHVEDLVSYHAEEHVIDYPLYPFLCDLYEISTLFEECLEEAIINICADDTTRECSNEAGTYISNNNFCLVSTIFRHTDGYCIRYTLTVNPQ